MHLCDWALVAVAVGLWFRSQVGFELGYFWALAGTFQALLTPAIEFDDAGVAAVRILLLPRAHHRRGAAPACSSSACARGRARCWRLLLWSEGYLAAALLANALTGGNYGFLAHRPAQATLLDQFSDTRWLYVAQINLVAFVFFAALYLPWLIRDLTVRPRTP